VARGRWVFQLSLTVLLRKLLEAPKSATAATRNEAPRFAMSAKEAAAAIAASIAETAEPEPLPDDELKAIIRDGRV